MKRLDPNLLLAISTAFPLALLVATAALFGVPGMWIRNLLIVVLCTGGFVLLNPVLLKAMKMTPRPPLIHPDAPGTAVWAGLFPLMIIVAAAVPIFWPGHDYGLLVVIASVWFAATVESAIKAIRAR